ncbi:MAG: chemotaxis response regulator protein-glutamate methylesterase [Alphaproteobacteria bacterium]
MVCDDSAVFRTVLKRALEADPEILVTAVACNGQEAIAFAQRETFDVVVLDIEMPIMDGLTALPKILAAQPRTKIVIASTLTHRNASISLQALERGAADYVTKPTATSYMSGGGDDFRRELVAKVRALAGRGAPTVGAARAMPAVTGAPPMAKGGRDFVLRKSTLRRVEALAIGSSTGGPQALQTLLVGLKNDLKRVPVLITQHMPPTFTKILAEHISRSTGLRASEGIDGESVCAGRIYVAPGDFHMEVVRRGTEVTLRLHQGERENFCRPAVDPMLRSMVTCWYGAVLTVILTGMGQDGMNGARNLVEAGGTVVAQDEDSSVVWGMPGAVAMAGLCSAVMPIDKLAEHVRGVLAGRAG